MLIIATTSAALVGFMFGLLTFKRSGRWREFCETCGVTKVCPLEHGNRATPERTAVAR